MTKKRILLHENPERGGEVDPTKPQFTPLIPEFPRPASLEYGKTIEDCKDKFDNIQSFTGHPFIPPMPPDGGDLVTHHNTDAARLHGLNRKQCPTCGGEGWVIGTRPSPEPEYDVCETCGGDPGDWCSTCQSSGEVVHKNDWLEEDDVCDVCLGEPFPKGDWCIACEAGMPEGMPENAVCEICGGNPPENGDYWCVNPDCQKNTKNDDG